MILSNSFRARIIMYITLATFLIYMLVNINSDSKDASFITQSCDSCDTTPSDLNLIQKYNPKHEDNLKHEDESMIGNTISYLEVGRLPPGCLGELSMESQLFYDIPQKYYFAKKGGTVPDMIRVGIDPHLFGNFYNLWNGWKGPCEGTSCEVMCEVPCFVSVQEKPTSEQDVHIFANCLAGSDITNKPSKQLWGMYQTEPACGEPSIIANKDVMQHMDFWITFHHNADFYGNPYAVDPYFVEYLLSNDTYRWEDKQSMVAFANFNCNTLSRREQYVQQLMQHVEVHAYGPCLHNREFPPESQNVGNRFGNLPQGNRYDVKIRVFRSYFFGIAIENALHKDFVTEKTVHTMAAGAVPIVLNRSQIVPYLPSAKAAIFIDDFPDIKSLADYLKYLVSNRTAYEEHHAWRKTVDPLLLRRFYQFRHPKISCDVCRMAAQYKMHPDTIKFTKKYMDADGLHPF